MAEGFEPYHVPQQSRRDKLRVAAAAELHGFMATQDPHPPPYDHRHLVDFSASSSPSDLLTCAPKEDNLMALAGVGVGVGVGSSSSSSNLRSPYYGSSFDPSLLYGAAAQMMHGGAAASHDHQVVVFKPEPLSLSLSSYNNGGGGGDNELVVVGGLGNDGGVSRGSVPLGPFTGYASVLKGSRFLRPAQQLLEELCSEVIGVVSPEKLAPDSSLMVMDTNAIVDDDEDHDHDDGDDDGEDDHDHDPGVVEIQKKKSKLISMLDEVYRKYKQYYQQMQAVVTSFEYVAGLGNAAPYANLAVKAMTRHFRCLKNAIMDQLQFAGKAYPGPTGKDEPATFRSSNRSGLIYGQIRPTHTSGFLDHHQPVWRPQRGLPERAVTVLRAWLFEHFLHPYPTDTDKLMLAKQTGLSRSQVSNWFINARVRLWKPMVEEIHMLETRQAQKAASSQDVTKEANPTPSMSKRSRNEPVPTNDAGTSMSTYDDNEGLARQLRAGPGGGRTGGGVSLTLGLHQDGGICLTEPTFSINPAQRFGIGLEGSTGGGAEGFAMSAFEAHQNRHFGGQLLHDFVG